MRLIGIVGSRRRDSMNDLEVVERALHAIWEPGDGIVSGGCPKGGDRFAEILAHRLGVRPTIHYPDRSKLDPKLPARAAWAKVNYARNSLIARDSDVLIACVAADRKGGTEHTIREFQRIHPKGQVILV